MMDIREFGSVLGLIIVIYFLCKLGQSLATTYFQDSTFPWICTAGLAFVGWLLSSKNNWLGLLGFLPICTYILWKSLSAMPSGSTVRKKIQSGVLSISTSSIMFVVTHSVFGFGMTQASISAIGTAAVLAFLGFSS
jgi:hypothetical protein